MSGTSTILPPGMLTPDIRTRELKRPVDVAEYLFQRLHQVGVRSVHGVPGDYNLVALDYLSKCNLNWVGNVNELNAGYAADGYARIKGISAIITTFGVGELSAINAIAGAYSEYVPVVHIVGYPTTASQKNHLLLHHTLGNGDFNTFADMGRKVSCAVSMLNDAHEAATLIDDAIKKCYLLSRPVYIALPANLVSQKVEGDRLDTPLNLEYSPNHTEKKDYVVDVVLKSLVATKNPIILVDACAVRHRALKETDAFIRKSGIPTFVAPMGKGAVDETLPTYGGVYAGDGSNAGVKERVDAADLIINIGAIKSDFNTAGFNYRTSTLNTIDLHSYGVTVRYSEYPGVRMNGVLHKVTERLPKLSIQKGPVPSNAVPKEVTESSDSTITQAWLWPRVGQWLRAGDIVITETGTSNFGIWETRFPKGVTAISQVLWGSIGYATGCLQGAALAAKELGRERTILFTGDGSFQLSAQEVSTMIRRNLNPIIFVICNDGYTIERAIHGWEAEYNDIQNWNYKDLPAAFGAKPEQYQTYQIKTKDALNKLFADESFNVSPALRFVELYMPRDDVPAALLITAESASKRNLEG